MPDEGLPTEQILDMLVAGPPRIDTLTADLSPEQLRMPPGPGEWSANEVLAHLRACADMWGKYMAIMLAEDRPTLRAISPRTWIKRTDYLEQEFHASLQAFATQRADLLAVLTPLTPEAWSRTATMTGAGKRLERTVLSYAQSLATHERPHIKQIERIVQRMRDDREVSTALHNSSFIPHP